MSSCLISIIYRGMRDNTTCANYAC